MSLRDLALRTIQRGIDKYDVDKIRGLPDDLLALFLYPRYCVTGTIETNNYDSHYSNHISMICNHSELDATIRKADIWTRTSINEILGQYATTKRMEPTSELKYVEGYTDFENKVCFSKDRKTIRCVLWYNEDSDIAGHLEVVSEYPFPLGATIAPLSKT